MESERVRPPVAATGDPQVDEAVAGLAALDDLDLADRPAVLAGVHDRLREILGELGEPGQPAPARRPGDSARPGEPGRRGEQGQLGGGASNHQAQSHQAQSHQAQPHQAPPRPGPPVPGRPVPGSGPRPGSWSPKPNA